ncbi:MAG TPA: nitroreductase family deazaflavin-dependent oxidoreductase [Jatrophihabitans sp.]|jgi:deazaflavin-dependent oxidoreductase (nitroreductase family)
MNGHANTALTSPTRHDKSSPMTRHQNLGTADTTAPAAAQDLFDGEYEPSPAPRIRDQVARYEATGGTEGNTLEDRPVVILTTIGAKSGKVRKNPIMRIEDNGSYVAVASAGGAPKNPSWYANLIAHPDVLVQDGGEVIQLRARELSGTEKQHWWPVAEHFWPHYPEYRQRAAGREIPLVLLEPITR